MSSDPPVHPLASRLGAVAAIAVFSVAAWTFAALQPTHGLRGRYFTDLRWNGAPRVERVDAAVGSALLAVPPASVWQAYAIEWTGGLVVSRAGVYTLATSSDDASEVLVGDVRVVDNLGEHRRTQQRGALHLDAGVHPLRVRYAQYGGRYAMELLWAREGDGLRPIPTRALVPDVPGPAAWRTRTALPWAAAGLVLGLGLLAIHRGGAAIDRAARTTGAARLAAIAAALEQPRTALLMLLGIGGCVRVAVVATTPPILWPDSFVFYQTALDILRGHLAAHDAYRTLAYPCLLAVVLKTTQAPWTGVAVQAGQAGLGLAAASGLYLVGRRAFPPLVALAGALLYAVHPVTLFYEASVLTETLFTATLAVALWLAVRMLESPSGPRGLAAGAACGAAMLVRPVAQWFPLVVVGLLVVGGRPTRARSAAAAAVVAAYLAAALPMAAINQREFGFRGVSLGQGMGLYIRVFEVDGLAPPPTAGTEELRLLWAHAEREGWHANRVRDELNYGRRYSSAIADRLMFALARDTALAHAPRFVAASLGHWARQIADPGRAARRCDDGRLAAQCPVADDGDRAPWGAVPSGLSPLARLLTWYMTTAALPVGPAALLAALGVAGLLARRGGPSPAAALVVATVAYITLVAAMSQWTQDRYRLPVDALYFMLAAFGARWLGRRMIGTSAPRSA